MDYSQVIKDIGEIINWYHKTKLPLPDVLMDQYRALTTLLCSYATYAADIKDEYNVKYFMRKIGMLREQQNLIKTGLAVNKAEIESLLATEDQFNLEQAAEAEAYRVDLFLRQANKVADCMRSHLSLIKKEIENENN